MKIGIGLPGNVPGAPGGLVLEWARRADQGPFSTLGVIDRLVYDNYEPLITLAAAAGVTSRIRLLTGVLLAPLRDPVILAKQAATLDVISGGRLTLGVGVGRRPDDYQAASVAFNRRGRLMEANLAVMRRVWNGEAPADGVGPVGPPPAQPGGPEILIGGGVPQAVRRVGKWGQGFIAGGSASSIAELYEHAVNAWNEEGRPGRPRLAAVASYALGPGAADKVGGYIRHYYSFLGPVADQMAQGAISSTEAVKGTIADMSNIGVDELVFLPSAAEIDQLERLADIVA